jgi:CMP-N-acetylneuraminic acid synthetase
MIPARLGSQRLAQKNLVLLAGEPLISYAIRAATDSGVFDRVVINSESLVFKKVAEVYGAEFYHRPEELASAEAQSDDVVQDFMLNHQTDVVAWVNPIAPLQPADEVREVMTHFVEADLDSLITVREEPVHCNYQGRPLNYDPDEKFARTQDLAPVERFVYSLMVWKTQTFLDTYDKNGYAVLFGKMGFPAVSRESSIIVKKEEDIRMCEYILQGMQANKDRPLTYFEVPGEDGQ